MKNYLFLLLLVGLSTSFTTESADNSLVVTVRNVKHQSGNVKAIVYNRTNFLTEKFVVCTATKSFDSSTKTVKMSFKNLPSGAYAVAIYHDLNANDTFDRNWLGIPVEPFGISNNLNPYNLRAPSFNQAKVDFSHQTVALTIDLLNN
jgi:uncharacterized protein (DUF2141 family)